jgi:ribosomal protein uS2
MTEQKTKEEPSLRSLADELKQKISEEANLREDDKDKSKKSLEVSDEELEKLSKSITKKEVAKEVKDLQEKEDGGSKKETLIPLEDYIKCAVHLGTKVITPHMKKYVYKRRADGLAVINTASIDEKLREAIAFLVNYDPEVVYLVCKREAGWPAAEMFSKATGIKVFTKKYPPGITTNLALEDFFESELTIICDPWIDKNALFDTAKLKKPVLSLCDTNNFTVNVTKLIPCNNKSKKSIGCILYILAREYCKQRKIPFKYNIEDFTGKLEGDPLIN